MSETDEPAAARPLQLDDDGFCRIAVIGSRSWPEAEIEAVELYVRFDLPQNTHLISGGGGIVDKTAAKVARQRALRVTEYTVDKTGLPDDPTQRRFAFAQRAYARDKTIAAECFYLVAFWNPYLAPGKLNQRGGTRYTVKQARELGRPVMVILPRGIDPRLKQHQI